MDNYSCQQCGGNCKSCNSTAISQCFITCKSNEYQIDSNCYTCPTNCKACENLVVCISCGDGYVLRNNNCTPICLEGCYLCDPNNTLSCLICFVGYFLSSDNTCQPDITCNNSNSCSICQL